MTSAPVDPAAVAATAARRAGSGSARCDDRRDGRRLPAARRRLGDPAGGDVRGPAVAAARARARRQLPGRRASDGRSAPGRDGGGQRRLLSVRRSADHCIRTSPGSGPGPAAASAPRQVAPAGVGDRTGAVHDHLDLRSADRPELVLQRVPLGARPERYHVDFYGPMDDGPNRGQPTDRVDAVWDLHAGTTTAAASRVAVDGPAGPGWPICWPRERRCCCRSAPTGSRWPATFR